MNDLRCEYQIFELCPMSGILIKSKDFPDIYPDTWQANYKLEEFVNSDEMYGSDRIFTILPAYRNTNFAIDSALEEELEANLASSAEISKKQQEEVLKKLASGKNGFIIKAGIPETPTLVAMDVYEKELHGEHDTPRKIVGCLLYDNQKIVMYILSFIHNGEEWKQGPDSSRAYDHWLDYYFENTLLVEGHNVFVNFVRSNYETYESIPYSVMDCLLSQAKHEVGLDLTIKDLKDVGQSVYTYDYSLQN